LNAGCGYGGSCFPKDVRTLAKTGEEYGLEMKMIKSIDEVNEEQKKILPSMIRHRFGEDMEGVKIAVLGLSFKPNTDDMRDAPSVTLIKDLLGCGATIVAFDPVAACDAKKILSIDVNYAESVKDAVVGVDAAALVTEWPEFKLLDWNEMGKKMNEKIIFDGRNVFDPREMAGSGFEYYCIGRNNGFALEFKGEEVKYLCIH
jgi:UDPglucose 6-dehydrogenase